MVAVAVVRMLAPSIEVPNPLAFGRIGVDVATP